MLPSQRALFDIPREVCFLNAASWSPLPLATQEVGRTAAARKGRPWLIDPAFQAEQYERARRAAARLIKAGPEDVALISSVAYGVATAAKVLPVPAGSRVLVLEDDHSSPVLEWMSRSRAGGFSVETVRRPGNGDWTEALLTAIARAGAPPIAVASFSTVHWSDSGAIDLARVAPALRARGQPSSSMPRKASACCRSMSARSIPTLWCSRPTSGCSAPTAAPSSTSPGVIRPAFRWSRRAMDDARCGPTRMSILGMSSTSAMRAASTWASAITSSPWRWRRSGMELVAEWGSAAIAARLAMLTGRLADGLSAADVVLPQTRLRAPHILSVGFPKGIPDKLIEGLAAQSIFVARRIGRMRISPHVYNDETDIDRFLEAIRRLLA